MATHLLHSRFCRSLLSGLVLLFFVASARADRPLRQFTIPQSEQGESFLVFDIAFSHDGSMVAVCSHDRVAAWDVASGEMLGVFHTRDQFLGNMLFDVEFNAADDGITAIRLLEPDIADLANAAQQAAEGGGELGPAELGLGDALEILTWDLNAPDAAPSVRQIPLEGMFGLVENAMFLDHSPDGKFLAISSQVVARDFSPGHLINLETGEQRTLVGDKEFEEDYGVMSISSIHFSADSARVIGVGLGAAIWDVETGQLLHFIAGDPTERPTITGFDAALTSENNELVAVLQEGFEVWDVDTGQRVFTTAPDPDQPRGVSRTHVSFTSDTRGLALLKQDTGQLQMWDIAGRVQVDPFWPVRSRFTNVALSPRGNYLAALTENQNTLLVWEVPESAFSGNTESADSGEESPADAATEDSQDEEATAQEPAETQPAGESTRPPLRELPNETDHPSRTWTIEGEPVEAALVRAGSISIVLLSAEGETLRVRRDTLSEDDEAYLERLSP